MIPIQVQLLPSAQPRSDYISFDSMLAQIFQTVCGVTTFDYLFY